MYEPENKNPYEVEREAFQPHVITMRVEKRLSMQEKDLAGGDTTDASARSSIVGR